MDEVSSILSDIAMNGHPPVRARDCRRLGRYQQGAQSPRSINSTIDVSNVLSNCHQLPARISIRPDLSPLARKEHSIYLGERRKLINAGLERNTIKLKKSGLFVSNELFGKVVDNVFVMHKSLSDLAPQLSHSLTNTSAESFNPQSPLTLCPDTVSDSSSPHNSSSSPSFHSNAPLPVTSNPVSDGLPPSSSSPCLVSDSITVCLWTNSPTFILLPIPLLSLFLLLLRPGSITLFMMGKFSPLTIIFTGLIVYPGVVGFSLLSIYLCPLLLSPLLLI